MSALDDNFSLTQSVIGSVRELLRNVGVGHLDSALVACSGGGDSQVLAHVAMTLSRAGQLGPVTLVYVDHGLRPNTVKEATVVEALANSGGAQFRCLRVEVDRDCASLEASARRARYQALTHAAKAIDAEWILTAHTASDQAETVVMRMLRGTGVAGLAAIPRRRGQIVRPLLNIERAEIDHYCQLHGLCVMSDPSNMDRQFSRNRIRHDILPILRLENPSLDTALCRLATAASEQRAALEYAADQLLIRCGYSNYSLDISELLVAPTAVVKRALTVAVQHCGARPLEARHLELLVAELRRPPRGTIELDLPGMVVTIEYNMLRLRQFSPPPRVQDSTLPDSWPDLSLQGVEERWLQSMGSIRAVVVAGPRPPYHVRRWQPGDRMRPQRLTGRSRKLSDLFADAKVPRHRRPSAIIVSSQARGVIEWAEHLGAAWQSGVEVTLVDFPKTMGAESALEID